MVLDASPMENAPTRLLLIDTAWVGDVVFTTALVEAAKCLWPEASLTILVSPRAEGIVRSHPHIREVIVYDKAKSERGLAALFTLGRGLRERKFDLVLCAHPSFRSAWLAKLSAAPVRVGYKSPWAPFCFTHTCANDLALEPFHVERRLNLLRAAGFSIEDPGIHVAISSEAQEFAARFLEGAKVSSPLLGLVPGSAWATKRWPAKKFRELAAAAGKRLQAQCLIFAGKEAGVHIREIVEGVEPEPILVLGQPLEHVAALLSKCHWVVGNDTGLSYLAIAVGGPAVRVLYGSTQVNFRFRAPHQAIVAGVPCCCRRTGHGKRKCSWGDPPVCMDAIEPERVLVSLMI
ncbi:MAG: glycosyltransferase family 9 protein [bacterium]